MSIVVLIEMKYKGNYSEIDGGQCINVFQLTPSFTFILSRIILQIQKKIKKPLTRIGKIVHNRNRSLHFVKRKGWRHRPFLFADGA